MQKARRRALPCGHSAPTACRRTVSSSISLRSPRFFSPFPHGTGSLSVVGEYLALPDGPGGFPRDFSCPAVLGKFAEGPASFRLGGCHPLWPAFPGRSASSRLCNPPSPLQRTQATPTTPALQRLQAWHSTGLGSSDFARRYFRNHGCFLFHQVLRWFTSLSWLLRAYGFSAGLPGMTPAGFPHSDIPGSKPACGSPRLIAACHVLRRLPTPRHPPYALSSLTQRASDALLWRYPITNCQRTGGPVAGSRRFRAASGGLVEMSGFEPPTPCVQGRCSPS